MDGGAQGGSTNKAQGLLLPSPPTAGGQGNAGVEAVREGTQGLTLVEAQQALRGYSEEEEVQAAGGFLAIGSVLCEAPHRSWVKSLAQPCSARARAHHVPPRALLCHLTLVHTTCCPAPLTC